MRLTTDTPIEFERGLSAELILAAIRARSNQRMLERVAAIAANAKIDWFDVIRTAREHGVLPIVFHVLQNASAMPTEISTSIRGELQHNHLRNLQLMRELTKLTAAMVAAKIRVLPYKGPALAMFAYGDLALRQPGDLDILVPPADVPAAVKILQANGYVPAPHSESSPSDANEYHQSLIHPQRKIEIELHWQLVGDLFSFEPDPIELWERGINRAVAGGTLRMMSPADTFIALAAHGMKHFWSRLGWICDLAELIRAEPDLDWDQTLETATALGGRGIVLLAANLAHRTLGAAVPSRVLRQTRPNLIQQADLLQSHLFSPADEVEKAMRGAKMQIAGGGLLQSLIFHFRTRDRWLDGLRYILHRMITPTAVERNWIKLPTWLAFLYYPAKPIRLLLKYGPRTITRPFLRRTA